MRARSVHTVLVMGLLVLASCGGTSASSEPAAEPPSTAAVPASAEGESPGGSWTTDEIDGFVDACATQAPADLCGCAVDIVQAELSFDELSALLGETISASALPPELLNTVLTSCL